MSTGPHCPRFQNMACIDLAALACDERSEVECVVFSDRIYARHRPARARSTTHARMHAHTHRHALSQSSCIYKKF